ncbi:MAG TPA: GNAT family N-acetyltransferase [Thermomicrobiales bacterium]|nr:GNAT family N-acetyltransferase [Thermomicrobiales bacterium]
METTPGETGAGTDLRVRPLRTDDLAAVDTVRRLAFGTFLGLPDPLTFRGDANPVRTRYLADPAGSVAGDLGGEVVGTKFVVDSGSVGFFGPLSVRPDLWDRGIARRLVEAALAEFDRRGTRHVGLFTFAHSPKHLALYQRYGFWPRFLTAIMGKPVRQPDIEVRWRAYADVPSEEQPAYLEKCREVSDAVHPGLDLSREIRATADHGFGDIVLLPDGRDLVGFAVCHCGADTEAGRGSCYVKFGAVRSGPDAEQWFLRLLAACEALAVSWGQQRLTAGVNTARREAYRRMQGLGFRTEVLGLAMDRPDEPGYNRPGVYLIDDWR